MDEDERISIVPTILCIVSGLWWIVFGVMYIRFAYLMLASDYIPYACVITIAVLAFGCSLPYLYGGICFALKKWKRVYIASNIISKIHICAAVVLTCLDFYFLVFRFISFECFKGIFVFALFIFTMYAVYFSLKITALKLHFDYFIDESWVFIPFCFMVGIFIISIFISVTKLDYNAFIKLTMHIDSFSIDGYLIFLFYAFIFVGSTTLVVENPSITHDIYNHYDIKKNDKN